MDADHIFDCGITAEMDSIYDSTSESKSTEKSSTFYFVKHLPYEDIELKNKIENANLKIQKINEEIECYAEDLKFYRKEKRDAIWKIDYWERDGKNYAYSIDYKREYLFHVQNALDKKSTHNTVALQSPEVKELTKHNNSTYCTYWSKITQVNTKIRGLKHRVQRERLTLKDEKQLIKQMKELKGEKDELVSVVSSDNKKRQDAVVKQYLYPYYKYKKIPMEKWPQAITEEIDELKAKQINCKMKMRYLSQYLEETDSHITYLVQKVDAAASKRDSAIELRRKSIKLADKLNACYYKSSEVINSAKHLAAMKDSCFG